MATPSPISDLSEGSFSGATIISSLTENGHLFLFSYSLDQKALISWSNNAAELLGVSDRSIAFDGNLFLRHVHPDDRFILLSDLEKALRGEASYRATYRWIRPDNNEVRWLHCRAALTQQMELSLFEGIIIDLSPEFTGPDARLAGPDSVAPILAALPTIVFTLDKDLRLLRINRPEGTVPFNFGDPDFNTKAFRIGKAFLPCFSDHEQRTHYERILLNLLGAKSAEFHTRISMAEQIFNLQLTPISERGIAHGILGVISDISELATKEQQIAELRKVEGLRLLAAGVAHNFNNVLQSVMGYAAAIHAHPDRVEMIESASQSILDAVSRATELSKQMSLSDNSAKHVLTPTDLNLSTVAALNRIDELLASGIKVMVGLGNPAPVMARQEDLVEAIEAILRNAKDALGTQGELSIRTYQVTLQELQVADLRAGVYSKLKITDSGSGMDAETRRRCFEPFFTKKERDAATGVGLKGSGLGLTKVFSTIRGYGGAVVAESESDRGTSISIFLPVAEPTTPITSEQSALEPAEILIIDDDAMVLETVSAILRESGYCCATASDSESALALVKAHRESLRLALVDAVMPGMDSAAAVRRMKRIHPNLTVIGFSGATEEYTRPLLEAGAIEILKKPLDPRKLQLLIREKIQGSRQASAKA